MSKVIVLNICNQVKPFISKHDTKYIGRQFLLTLNFHMQFTSSWFIMSYLSLGYPLKHLCLKSGDGDQCHVQKIHNVTYW